MMTAIVSGASPFSIATSLVFELFLNEFNTKVELKVGFETSFFFCVNSSGL